MRACVRACVSVCVSFHLVHIEMHHVYMCGHYTTYRRGRTGTHSSCTLTLTTTRNTHTHMYTCKFTLTHTHTHTYTRCVLSVHRHAYEILVCVWLHITAQTKSTSMRYQSVVHTLSTTHKKHIYTQTHTQTQKHNTQACLSMPCTVLPCAYGHTYLLHIALMNVCKRMCA
jgi:hypothetical protein